LALLIVYNLSSTKLKIRAKQFLPGRKGMGQGRGGERGRNDPNFVCTYE
jgi:hypothetical protein